MRDNFISTEKVSKNLYKTTIVCSICNQKASYFRKTNGLSGREICENRECYLEMKRRKSEKDRNLMAIITTPIIEKEKIENERTVFFSTESIDEGIIL